MRTSNFERYFNSLLNEDAAADVAEYKRLGRKVTQGVGTLNKAIAKKKTANSKRVDLPSGAQIYLYADDFSGDFRSVYVQISSKTGEILSTRSRFAPEDIESGNFPDIDSIYQSIIDHISRILEDEETYSDFRNDLLEFASYMDDLDEDVLQDTIEEEVTKFYNNYMSAANRYKNVNKALANRSNRAWAARDKAEQSLYDEAPDYEENGYAYWQSKNGPRRVTVLSIDEPNNRAKINTDKGATMYVPLDTLSKDQDGLYDVLDEE